MVSNEVELDKPMYTLFLQNVRIITQTVQKTYKFKNKTKQITK